MLLWRRCSVLCAADQRATTPHDGTREYAETGCGQNEDRTPGRCTTLRCELPWRRMTDDEFEAACDDLMALIDADGSSACIADRTLSIDLHDWQVDRLAAVIKGSIDHANNRERYTRRLIERINARRRA